MALQPVRTDAKVRPAFVTAGRIKRARARSTATRLAFAKTALDASPIKTASTRPRTATPAVANVYREGAVRLTSNASWAKFATPVAGAASKAVDAMAIVRARAAAAKRPPAHAQEQLRQSSHSVLWGPATPISAATIRSAVLVNAAAFQKMQASRGTSASAIMILTEGPTAVRALRVAALKPAAMGQTSASPTPKPVQRTAVLIAVQASNVHAATGVEIFGWCSPVGDAAHQRHARATPPFLVHPTRSATAEERVSSKTARLRGFVQANAFCVKARRLAFAAVRSTKTVPLSHAVWASAPSPAANVLTIRSAEASAALTSMELVHA